MNDLDDHERRLVFETLCSLLRHDVRNKVSSARMAAHWLHKKGLAAGLDTEKRFEQFHAVLNSELVGIDALLTARLPSNTGKVPIVGNVSPQVLIDRALGGWDWPGDVALEHLGTDGGARGSGDDVRVNAMVDDVACGLRAVLRNAIEASPPGGVVRLRCIVDDAFVSFEVSDDGPGLSEEQRAKGANGFSSTRPGRAGLGIAIASKVARAHGGELAFAVEAPTRVTLRLAR